MDMLKNYWNVTIRNLWKNKVFSGINILGLAVGIAGTALILLWVQSELSIDQFHTKKDRLFFAWNKEVFDGRVQCWPVTPQPMAEALKKDYPDIKETSRYSWENLVLLAVGDKKLTASGNFVDPGFLSMFTLPMETGNPQTALNDSYSIVITKTLAKKLFGSTQVLGKSIRMDDRDNFRVTGVLQDLPLNTDFTFEYLLPFKYLRRIGHIDDSWGDNNTRTVVELQPNVSLAQLNKKVETITRIHSKNAEEEQVFLYPFDRMHLYSNFTDGREDGGKIDVVLLFATIAFAILLIACINFMNLSTARSVLRAKEVGVRKVTGARKGMLIGQFIAESTLMSFLATVLAFLVIVIAIPSFDLLTGKQIHIPYGSPAFWLSVVLMILVTGLLAGSYPAFYLSSLKAVKIFKGSNTKNAKLSLRKVLVVVQFTFAVTLIISTIIVQSQVKYAQQRDMGYDKANLVYLPMTGTMAKNYSLIEDALVREGAATAVCKTSSPVTSVNSDSWDLNWEGKDQTKKIDFDIVSCRSGFIKTFGLKLVQGRDIDTVRYKTDTASCIFNQTGAATLGFKNPIGKLIKREGKIYTIVGIVKDFIMRSPYDKMKNLLVVGNAYPNFISFRLNPNRSTTESIVKAEKIFKRFNPFFPFDYKFADVEYARKFDDQQRTARLSAVFAGLTIFISCLGLFGLSIFMAQNRIKEIGIRKVLGASIGSITSLLAKDFLKLVLVAIVIATPFSWLAMNHWLTNFDYRMQISWWIFAYAGTVALVIAALTVSFQAVKAAVANPVKSLRSE